MPTPSYIQHLKELLAREQYEHFGVTDYLTFPGAVNPEKAQSVRENYDRTYRRPHAEGVQMFMFNPASTHSSTLQGVARNIRRRKFAECSNFACGGAGVILQAMENGSLDGSYNVTITGISEDQNHNVALIYPKDMPPPQTWADFYNHRNDILIVDPWAFALGHGDSSVYTVENFPLQYMLTRATTHYQSKDDASHIAQMMQLQRQQPVVNPQAPEDLTVHQRVPVLPLPRPTIPLTPPLTAEDADKPASQRQATESAYHQFLFYSGLVMAGAGSLVAALLAWPWIGATLTTAGILTAASLTSASEAAVAVTLSGAVVSTYAFFTSHETKQVDEQPRAGTTTLTT